MVLLRYAPSRNSSKGAKQIKFKNVVYEYPLSKAIEDGYTRTPFAVTRSDIDFYNFGDEALDKLMLTDGITFRPVVVGFIHDEYQVRQTGEILVERVADPLVHLFHVGVFLVELVDVVDKNANF